MIKIENLTKDYGSYQALNNINIHIKKNGITGILGTNGAGKSTLMNIITGYISLTKGFVKVNGLDILENPQQIKRKIGYLPESPPLYLEMTVKDYLIFVSRLKKMSRKNLQTEIAEKMSLLRIEHVQNRLIKNLSKGYRQRVGLAQAMLGSPELLILDEPTVGLDPKEIIEIRKLIKEIGEGCTVLFSSHILSEVSLLCDQVVILDNGDQIATGKPDELINKRGNINEFLIRVKGKENLIMDSISEVEGITTISKKGSFEQDTLDFLVISKEGFDVREKISLTLAKNDFPILMMKSIDVTLEDIFLKLTSNEEGD